MGSYALEHRIRDACGAVGVVPHPSDEWDAPEKGAVPHIADTGHQILWVNNFFNKRLD